MFTFVKRRTWSQVFFCLPEMRCFSRRAEKTRESYRFCTPFAFWLQNAQGLAKAPSVRFLTRLAPSRSGFQVSSSLKLSEPKASTQAKKQWKDLVTGFFLLKKPATPPRAVALRLSSPLLKKEVITSLLFCTKASLLCAGEDLNLHARESTSTSRMLVYQFQHLRLVKKL